MAARFSFIPARNMKEKSSGWFIVSRAKRKTFLRLPISDTDYTRAYKRFLTDKLGNRWTVGQRIG